MTSLVIATPSQLVSGTNTLEASNKLARSSSGPFLATLGSGIQTSQTFKGLAKSPSTASALLPPVVAASFVSPIGSHTVSRVGSAHESPNRSSTGSPGPQSEVNQVALMTFSAPVLETSTATPSFNKRNQLSLSLPQSSATPRNIEIPSERLLKCLKEAIEQEYKALNCVFENCHFEEFTLEKVGVGNNHPYFLLKGGNRLAIIKPIIPSLDLLASWKKKLQEHLKTSFSDQDLREVFVKYILRRFDTSSYGTIPFHSQALRERVASELGKELGVPSCTLVLHPEHGVCTKHTYVVNSRSLEHCNCDELERNVDVQSLQNICLLDLLLVSQDRNEGNVLMVEEGEKHTLIPIDHGYILPETETFIGIKSCLSDQFSYFNHDEALTEDSLAWMRSLDWKSMELKLDEIGDVSESIKNILLLTSTLLRTIGKHPLVEELKLSSLIRLFVGFETTIKGWRLPQCHPPLTFSGDLVRWVEEVKKYRKMSLDELCEDLLNLLIDKEVKLKGKNNA